MNGLERLSTALAGRYTVEREVGAGGMATVYLAHDVRHDRQVAIKVLPEDLGATLGPERFLAEIKTTAKLQHPHILPLLDSGEASGLLYYVMPYVEGETLRTRLTRETQLPIEDAVRIAREVADALGFAHGHGTVHRDIKPENILLQGGHALVADFGIALAVQHAGGTRLTQTGLSLGTPQYMSPEQAMGEKSVGPSADLYALGAVTYEMLTGEPPFTGATVQAIVAKVLSSEPERPRTIRKTVPGHVEAAVLKALAKLPADRFTSAVQFGDALAAAPLHTLDAPQATESRVGREAQRTARWWPTLAVAASMVAIASTAFAIRATRAARDAIPLSQYDVVLPDSAPMALDLATGVDISPRGDFAVYVARRGNATELWYRSLVDTISRPLPGTSGATMLAISPDGKSVALIAGNRLRLASLASNPVRDLGTVRRPVGISWRAGDRVVVGDTDLGLMEFDQLGGTPVKLASVNCFASFVVSEREILCNVGVFDLERDSLIPLTIGATGSRADGANRLTVYAPEAIDRTHLIYTAADGSIIGAQWSPETGIVRQRTMVHSGIRDESVYGYRQAAVSASGTLVFVPGSFNGSGQLVRNDGTGPAQPLPIEPMTVKQFEVSPDGRRIAVVKVTADANELWIYDMVTGEGFQRARAFLLQEPRWSPDGRRVVVLTFDPPGHTATVVISQQSVAAPDTLRGSTFTPSHWFAEHRIIASAPEANGNSALAWVELEGTRLVRVDTTHNPRSQFRGVVSPDGRLFAYVTSDEIAVEVMGGGGRSIVGRGIDPLWLDARTLAIRGTIGVWSKVRLDADASPLSRPQPWFTDPRFVDTVLRSNAVTPNGEIVYVQGSAQLTSSFLRVVPRWTDQVRAAIAAAQR